MALFKNIISYACILSVAFATTGTSKIDALSLRASRTDALSLMPFWASPETPEEERLRIREERVRELDARAAAARPSAVSEAQDDKHPSMREETTCAICLNDLDGGAAELGCKHKFCKECIDQWLNCGTSRPRCPTCREPCDEYVGSTGMVRGAARSRAVSDDESDEPQDELLVRIREELARLSAEETSSDDEEFRGYNFWGGRL